MTTDPASTTLTPSAGAPTSPVTSSPTSFRDFAHREVCRRRLQSSLDAATANLLDPNCHHPPNLRVSLDLLFHYSATVRDLDTKIQGQINNKEDYKQDAETAYDLQDKVRVMVMALEDLIRQQVAPTETTMPSHRMTPLANHPKQAARLPQLELPTFSGNPLNWCSFWDSFESAVHSTHLADVDKFNYLKSLLKGVAADAISGVCVSNATYLTAITIIQERFGQKQLIINAHVESLLSIPKSTAETSRLRATYDACETHIRGLHTLNVTASTNGTIMTPIILSKLPDEVRLLITRKNGAAVGDLNTLRELLKLEVEARELCSCSVDPVNKPVTDDTFTTTSFPAMTQKVSGCSYCGNTSHNSFNCKRFPTPAKRHAKVMADKRCLNCLVKGHFLPACPVKTSCKNCNQRHHTSLCPKSSPQFGAYNGSRPSGNQVSYPKQTINNVVMLPDHQSTAPVSPMLVSTGSSIVMQTATAKIKGNDGSFHNIRILFDTGSGRSYVTQSLITRLQLHPQSRELLSIAGFGSIRTSPKEYDVIQLRCYNANQSTHHDVKSIIVPMITCPVFRTALDNPAGALRNLILADPPCPYNEHLQIDVLIGMDHYWDVIHNHILPKTEHGLTAISSIFGWLLSGNLKHRQDFALCNTTALFVNSIPDDNFLKQFWEVESVGVTDDHQSTIQSFEDDPVLQSFESTISFANGRFVVGLPWRPNSNKLPDNYALCKRRLFTLLNRLHKDNLMPAYQKVLTQQLSDKFIEEVVSPHQSVGVLHYILHHPVVRNDRATTKLRIVYDASAKLSANHPSLNECLHPGPNLLSDLFILLLKFRAHDIVLLADVEKAFLQVSLHPHDRDATRFMWLRDVDQPVSAANIVTYRFTRVPFGASSSPFLLAATVRHHLKNSTGPVSADMLHNFYVDNLITGTKTVTQAMAYYQDAKVIMKQAGMNLREWLSNSDQVCRSIPHQDRASEVQTKVLGLPWHSVTDLLHVKAIPPVEGSQPLTKRSILQTIARVFDPLGLVTPVTISAKVLIQELWKLGIDWDSKPSKPILLRWNEIQKELSLLDTLKIPRHIFITSQSNLHVFVDASTKAYAAVAYIQSHGWSNLICSKTKVAPIKEETVPRLELIALVTGCILAKHISSVYNSVNQVYLWTDSQIVLCWLKNGARKQEIFVRNRISKIQDYKFKVLYCPTADNPADIPTRGKKVSLLLKSSLWWQGPSWLPNERTWPAQTIEFPVSACSAQDSSVTFAATTTISIVPPYNININRFESLTRLLNVTVLCARWIHQLRKHPNSPSGPITATESNDARDQWIKYIQCSSFNQEMLLLQQGKSNSHIKQLRLYIKDGFIVTLGRFKHAKLDPQSKDPVLLPKDNRFTELLIKATHENLLHQGVRHTLAKLRKSVWIPQGRQQVRVVLNRCRICRIWDGPAYRLPPTPPLPEARLSMEPAFTYTGCDFAGPLHIFKSESTSTQKVYICLFTCAVTRAIHLELVDDLTTSSFLMSLRRFVARRGIPKQIISDNARTFKLAKTVLEKMLHGVLLSPEVTSHVATHGIHWKFNVERAPWWGGFFERMVGLVKRCLVKATSTAKLSFVALNTILIEVEAIINTRPLTYVYNDQSEGNPLSPNNFLSDAKFVGFPTYQLDPDSDFNPNDVSAQTLLAKIRLRQHMIDHFWSIWLHDYLAALREHHHHCDKFKRSNTLTQEPTVGDVVLIKDPGLKRGSWKIRVVCALLHGKDDNLVRAAQVRTKGIVLQRPVNLLYPIEFGRTITTESSHKSPLVELVKRPIRSAAVHARKVIADQLGQSDDDT